MTAPFGQLLGQAQLISKTLFDHILTSTGTTFEQWVTLKLVDDLGGSPSISALNAALEAGLQRPAPLGEVDGLLTAGDGTVRHTAAGRERFDEIRTRAGALSADLQAGLSPADLEAAARVLTHMADRGRTQLARSL